MSKSFYQNIQHTRVMNLKYKSKYKRLKRQIKNFVFENAALCDEVAQIQVELSIAREERKYLLKRLMRHEGQENITNEQQQKGENVAPTGALPKARLQVPKKRGPKKRAHITGVLDKPEKNRLKNRDKVMLDNNGKPKFPINLCNILVHSQGEIIPVNPNFHTAHFIYPVGFVATRIYAHPRDLQRKCVYTCKILNNAGMPQFQIIPDNDLDSVFFGETANICHKGLLDALRHSLSDVVKLPMHVQGERFFGLTNPTVKSLLQMDPGFQQCANFKCFAVEEPNYSIAEEKDPTLNFEALQSLITMSVYHTMPEVKEEPPDELLDFN